MQVTMSKPYQRKTRKQRKTTGLWNENLRNLPTKNTKTTKNINIHLHHFKILFFTII